jgi:tRNA(adenine34) deaminase
MELSGDDETTLDDARFMAAALEQAVAAGERGEVPVGAVVVVDGEIVGAAGNEREAAADPTAHAEVLALRRAAAAGRSWRLGTATVYATLEPCPMCAGALVSARVARLVFATPDPKAGACGSLYNLCVDPRLNHEVAVEAGVGAEAAAELLRAWFASRRRRDP